MFGQYSANSRFGRVSRPVSDATTNDGKRTRTVFDNQMVAHVWAAQSQDAGRSNNGNFYFDGPTIYSYGLHFPIATILDKKVNGRRIVLFTTDSYSVTTSGHISDVRHALRGRDDLIVYCSLADRRGSYASLSITPDKLDAIRDNFIDRLGRAERDLADYTARAAENANGGDSYYAQRLPECRRELESIRSDFADFAKAYGYRKKLPASASDVLAAQAVKAKADKLADHVKTARNTAMRWKAELRVPKRTAPLPAPGSRNSYQVQDTIRLLERQLSDVNKARHWLAKGKAGREPRDVLNRARKMLAGQLENWTAFQPINNKALAKGELLLTCEEIVRFANGTDKIPGTRIRHTYVADVTGKYDWKQVAGNIGASSSHGGDLEQLLANVNSNAGDIPNVETVRNWIIQQIGIVLALRQLPIGNKPAWYYSRKPGMTEEQQRAAWINGETIAGVRYMSGAALVRRKGDTLETSQGATVPFREAVRIYRGAVECRRAGTPWHKNGERRPVGSFEVDRIDSEGSIIAGCHRINFREMERLAVREGVAVPTFPVPALA